MFQDANRLVVFGSQLIGVVIVIFGLLTEQAELHSPRPFGAQKTQVSAETNRTGDRFTRLWDDPLEDLPSMKATPPGEGPAPSATAAPPPQALPETTPASTPAPTLSPAATSPPQREQGEARANQLFIWNLLDAAPIAEVKERRLRTRYAVVSALLSSDYVPLHESLLTHLVTSADGAERAAAGYFETFRAVDKNARFARVTLIWSPREVVVDTAAIESAKHQIAERDKEQSNATVREKAPAPPEVRILHHGSSEDLADYIRDPQQFAAPISFTRATIRQEDLCGEAKDCIPRSLRSITADDVLVNALFDELALRIPALTATVGESSRPRIVVFTELDTNYSRGIASELRAKFDGKARLEIYSYLRGLDGRRDTPAASAERDKEAKDDAVGTLLHGKAISETSFSTSQFDYLRRSALRLQSRAKVREQGAVVAVGIMGSDIYDKMLVLQAVRPALPAAIIFTTDLDALYLERDSQPFTRNLVVASADSLDVNQDPKAGWQLPPMRDSYQTVLVNQVRQLLAGAAPSAAGDATPETPPHVFEIAGGKHVELTLPGSRSLRSRAAG
ncbi:MAG TPA: hypothetical protein VF683_05180, partial [Chthoniobacterales bacterium]